MSTYTHLHGNRNAEDVTLDRGHLRKEDMHRMSFEATAFVDSWGQGPADDMVSSLRIAGIGRASIGRELRVKVVARDGQKVLDAISWKIESQQSPDLKLSVPLPSNSIGAVLIAIE